MATLNGNNFIQFDSINQSDNFYSLPLIEGDEIKYLLNAILDDYEIPFSTLKLGLYDYDAGCLYIENVGTLTQVPLGGDNYTVYFEWTVPVLAQTRYKFVLYYDPYPYSEANEVALATSSNKFLNAGADDGTNDNLIVAAQSGTIDSMDRFSGVNLTTRSIMVHVKNGHTITFNHKTGGSTGYLNMLDASNKTLSYCGRILFTGDGVTFMDESVDPRVYYYYSNFFCPADAEDYTSFIKYRNSKNALDYYWENLASFYNQFRVDMRTGRPQFRQQTIGYETYQGKQINTRTNIQKPVEFETRFLDEVAHEAMFAVFQMSEFYIDSVRYEKGEGSEYAITWSEFDDNKIGNGAIELNKYDYSTAIKNC